jgi:hypothetical protein
VFLVASGAGETVEPRSTSSTPKKFLPNLPVDLELTSLSQTFGADADQGELGALTQSAAALEVTNPSLCRG